MKKGKVRKDRNQGSDKRLLTVLILVLSTRSQYVVFGVLIKVTNHELVTFRTRVSKK